MFKFMFMIKIKSKEMSQMRGLKMTTAVWTMLTVLIAMAAVMVIAALGPAPAVAQDGPGYFTDYKARNHTLDVTGSATIENLSTTGTVSLGTGATVAAGPLALTSAAVSLTSPTVTFSAANRTLVTLSSDANQTGVRPTGGTLGQVLIIKTGAGSNTMRFDDGTSMTVGSNRTITEGHIDILTLLCTSADGDEWALVAFGDN